MLVAEDRRAANGVEVQLDEDRHRQTVESARGGCDVRGQSLGVVGPVALALFLESVLDLAEGVGEVFLLGRGRGGRRRVGLARPQDGKGDAEGAS